MFSLLLLWNGALIRLFRSRGNLVLENLVLRQQLAVLKRHHPRSSLALFDKLFWVIVRRIWLAWKESLLIVTPETVVRWHRTGFVCCGWRIVVSPMIPRASPFSYDSPVLAPLARLLLLRNGGGFANRQVQSSVGAAIDFAGLTPPTFSRSTHFRSYSAPKAHQANFENCAKLLKTHRGEVPEWFNGSVC